MVEGTAQVVTVTTPAVREAVIGAVCGSSRLPDNVAGVGRDAVVGVASYNRDSGPHRGKRAVWGGRSRVRAVLYMGALVASRWNPVIREFYQRLLATSNPKKLAITACMRKLLTILNSMMRTGERWDTTIATS